VHARALPVSRGRGATDEEAVMMGPPPAPARVCPGGALAAQIAGHTSCHPHPAWLSGPGAPALCPRAGTRAGRGAAGRRRSGWHPRLPHTPSGPPRQSTVVSF
jgi:hypothetical protein